jgi:hypothetical protein
VDLERYIIEADENFLSYSFNSKGPKGKIKKVVKFTLIPEWQYQSYYLSFGHWVEKAQLIDDTVVSNNQDTEKVLATVGAIIIDFWKHYPGTLISVEASTDARMRLYQMKINKYWSEIVNKFEIFCYTEEEKMLLYKPGNKCLYFVGRRKIE